jgi:hypothetical protein
MHLNIYCNWFSINKIQEVNELKKKLLKAKKVSMKAKLERAEEKRQYLLRLKATKAAVEEQKAHEIAFINSLAAQNRKHDILEKHEKRQETIKQNLEEERLRKQEEQKAKEQAAEVNLFFFDCCVFIDHLILKFIKIASTQNFGESTNGQA